MKSAFWHSKQQNSAGFLKIGIETLYTFPLLTASSRIFRFNSKIKLTRDRRKGGGGRIWPPPSFFSWITSEALQVSSRNLAHLLIHQFYVLTQNFWKFSRFIFNYIDVSDPKLCHFCPKLICLKNHQNSDFEQNATKSTQRRVLRSS